jgi:hypothetical protein
MAAEAYSILTEPWDVNRRLAEMGLTEDILARAGQKGLSAWASCTGNHPLNYPGIASWAEAIRSLGEDLAVDGWSRVDISGQPLIMNRDGSIALTVASGDENTGKNGSLPPRTKASKGPRTVEAVEANAYLFPYMEEDRIAQIERVRNRRTWLLLMYRDLVSGELRCELSCPITMDVDRHIDGWSERIILKPVEFDGEADVKGYDEGRPDDGEITVEIRRRG